MAGLWVADLRTEYEAPRLQTALEFLLRTLAFVPIVYLAGRGFVARGEPGLLLLGCGVAIWGTSGFVATLIVTRDVNLGMTISSLGTWFSALCHLAGMLLTVQSKRTIRATHLALIVCHALSLSVVGSVTLATLAGWLPVFFVHGQGGTVVQHVMLGSAIAIFVTAVLLLRETNRVSPSSFSYWYTCALLLITTALFGMLIQSSDYVATDWMCRATQYLSGIYMFIAALASVRDPGSPTTTHGQAIDEAHYRYGVSLAIVLATAAARLAFFPLEGSRTAVLTFYPAVVLSALYGGLGAGLLATALSAILVGVFWTEPVVRITIGPPADWLAFALYLLSGAMISCVTEAMHRARVRATVAETEVGFAAERLRAAEALAKSEAKLRAVFHALVEGVVFLNPKGEVEEANDAVQRLHGHTLQELTDPGLDPRARIIRPDGTPFPVEEQPALAALRTGAAVRDVEMGVPTSHGKIRWRLVNAQPVYDDRGKCFGAVASFFDITERKQAEEVLRDLNATLESQVAQRTAELERRARQLQKLTLELTRAEERERRRIALILHEDLQQQIAGAKFHLNLVRGRVRDDQQRTDLSSVEEMLREAIETSRSLSHDLSPAVLDMNDLAEILRWLANRVRTQHGLVVRVGISGEATLQSEALALFLFRAAQEMLFNVVKHAQAGEAAIRVRRIERYVCLCVSDRGRGFDAQELRETAGLGLLGIRERVELLGGHMKIKSAVGKGSTFRIAVPDVPEAEHRKKKTKSAACVPAVDLFRDGTHTAVGSGNRRMRGVETK